MSHQRNESQQQGGYDNNNVDDDDANNNTMMAIDGEIFVDANDGSTTEDNHNMEQYNVASSTLLSSPPLPPLPTSTPTQPAVMASSSPYDNISAAPLSSIATTAAIATTTTTAATTTAANAGRRRGPITTLVSAVTSFRLNNNNSNNNNGEIASSASANSGGIVSNANNANDGNANANNGNNGNNHHQEVDAALLKRKAIQSIMRDASLTDLERRLRIQQLMDGSSKASSSNNGNQGGSVGGGIGGGIGTILGRSSSGNSSGLPLLFGSGGANNNNDNSNSIISGTHPSTSYASSSSTAAAATGSHIIGGANTNTTTNNNNNHHHHQEEVVACVHYERKCNIVAPCCGRIFGCRVCHDEMSGGYCGETMDRFAIREVVCKECHARQDSKSNKCIKCGVTFAQYHCPKCNIWMALDKRPFHCDQCGFCRVGGQENFRHCVQCCMCISTSVYDTHSCMQDKYKNNCPVCREDMFSSRQSPQDLPCGHAIHAHCFRNLAGFDYRCPICKKTVVSRASMSAAWMARARDIRMQPMPEDLARVVNIMCNDCERKSENCNWHFLGVQCPECSSFNTVVERMTSGNATANR